MQPYKRKIPFFRSQTGKEKHTESSPVMKNEALERMIDLAEKEIQIPIRKKSGAK
jgi:hypothetical protein